MLALFPRRIVLVSADMDLHMLTQICLAGFFSHPAESSLAIIFFLKVSAWGNKGKNAIGDGKSESRRGRNAWSIYSKVIKMGTECIVTYQGPLQFEQVFSWYYADSKRVLQQL